ncbi:hypothetical protein D3C87_2069810 [compost metagenome]
MNARSKPDLLRVVKPWIAEKLHLGDRGCQSILDLLIELLLRVGNRLDQVGAVAVSAFSDIEVLARKLEELI